MSTMADDMRMTDDELRADCRLLEEVGRIMDEGIQAMLRIYRSPRISFKEKERRIKALAGKLVEQVDAIYPGLGQ